MPQKYGTLYLDGRPLRCFLRVAPAEARTLAAEGGISVQELRRWHWARVLAGLRDRLLIERGPGRLVRTGLRSLRWEAGGVMYAEHWEALAERLDECGVAVTEREVKLLAVRAFLGPDG